jgi:Domain of unknown function (DUF4326)
VKPNRIQLRRIKGWRMPPNTKKVDRSTKWGNEFKVGDPGVPDRATAKRLFRKALLAGKLKFSVADVQRELGGWNLACCHADVLLELANQVDTEAPASSNLTR